MRVLIAARLSQKKDGQTGLETQDEESTCWFEANGHTVVHVAADRKSGTVQPWDRPNLREWVTDPVRIASYDAVGAYRLDRLTRGDNQSTNQIEAWAHQHGKKLLTVDGLVFPCEGADGIRWDVAKRIAHDEWLKASERYRRMQGWLRKNGYLVGPQPFGFRIVPHGGSKHKTLEPNPVQADAIREAVRRYVRGASLRELCAWLDSEGIAPPQGKKWQPVSLARVFRNPSLIGRRKTQPNERGRRRTILRHEAILDREAWDALQAEMDRRASRTGVAPATTALLTGIAKCAHCSGPMYRIAQSKKLADGTTRRYAYYRCHGTDTAPSKCANLVPLAGLDEWVDKQASADTRRFTTIMRVPAANPGRDEDIAQIEDDIYALDLDSPGAPERFAALHAERARLRSQPSGDARTEEVAASYSVGDLWGALEAGERRRFLLDAGVRVVVAGRDDYRLDGDLAKVAADAVRDAVGTMITVRKSAFIEAPGIARPSSITWRG